VAVGAQDCSPFHPGAHTGDLSATMIADAGAAFVILGHSERRTDHDEQSPTVREKVQAAVAAGLTPIVCVGETHDQRQAGLDTETVGYQLFGSLPKPFTGILAYEPVWAIGTGHTPTPDEISIMHGFIRAEMLREFGAAGQTVPILYGGSVKPANAAEILALPDVGGALVGGASLKAEDFLAIARAAA
jgi:triosephosphate isomerase